MDEGSIEGTTTAAAIVMESTSTDSTASSGTWDLFLEGFLAGVLLTLGALLVTPKKFGMLTGRVGNFMSGLAMSEDFSTPLSIAEGRR